MVAPVQTSSISAPRRPAAREIAPEEGSVLDGIGALQRETLGEQVTQELRSLLISGKLGPGEKLSLRKVADALGVSIMPVREAVSRLAADKALDVLPGKAVRVPLMSLPGFRELTRLRLVVEGFAAEEAARVATPEQIEAVARFESSFRAAASADPPDPAAAVATNRDLHFALYEAAGMPLLVETIARLWLKAGPILNLDMRHEPSRLDGGSAVRAHAGIVRALRARDSQAARAALEADIREAADHIERTGTLPS